MLVPGVVLLFMAQLSTFPTLYLPSVFAPGSDVVQFITFRRWHSTSWLVEILFRLLLTYQKSVPVLEGTANDTTSRVDWDKLSVTDKAAYVNNTDTILSSVRVDLGYLL